MLQITSLFAFGGSCWKVVFNQVTLIEFPLITVGGGMTPRYSWKVENMSWTVVGPVTTSLSIGRPRRMATSFSVTVVSPWGKWNVWVSNLHLSNKELMRKWFTSMSGIYKACLNPVRWIKFKTRGSIMCWLFSIQTPALLGLRTRSRPSHKSWVICSCWSQSSDISRGRRPFCAMLNMFRNGKWKLEHKYAN